MKKMKVMTLVGTRPEIIRLSRVIAVLDQYTDHVLVHSGQNYDYELNEVFFQDLEIRKPDFFLHAAAKTAAETIGQIIAKIDHLFAEQEPEAFLILGDTNSCLAVIAAKKRQIPIFHMEAGNRCFDQRVPEESNRKVIDHLSDINMPYSHIARDYLLKEGLPPAQIIKTGSPMLEVLQYYAGGIVQSGILAQLDLKPQAYMVVSCHRQENVDSDIQLEKLTSMLNSLAEKYQQRMIFSAHPRTRQRLEATGLVLHRHVEVMKPLGFFDYVHLQMHATVVLSDSGTITEEAAILNFPALNLRETHERPEGMEEAAVMMVGLHLERIEQAMAILAGQPRGEQRLQGMVRDYDAPEVSAKVLRIILSYTDYINRYIWRKKTC